MPRAHLGKRLPDAVAIQLFAEHHIVHVRRRKNGEIVAVKHSTYGWMSPQEYYGLQKLHDLMPLVQEFIRGGYQAKAWLWGVSASVFGIEVPIGGTLPLIETWNLYQEMFRTKVNESGDTVPDIHWDRLLFRLYALIGPWGDVLQMLDAIAHFTTPPIITGPGGTIISPGPTTTPGDIAFDFGTWLTVWAVSGQWRTLLGGPATVQAVGTVHAESP